MALQICGKQAKIPYYIKEIETNVYSIEEINYFIFNHISFVYREFFSEKLFDYIDNELGLREMASTLRQMAAEDASTQDFVKYILSESYYYTGHELSSIAGAVLNIDHLSEQERRKIEADTYYKNGKSESALRLYFDILNNMNTEELPETFYAKIAYSIGVIYAKSFMSKNANMYFSKAYEIYPDPAYAKACVYMSLVNNDEEELLTTIIKFNFSNETLDTIRERVGALRREIENSDETKEFVEKLESADTNTKIIDEWKEEYYERTR